MKKLASVPTKKKYLSGLSLSLAVTGLLFFFQNCGDVSVKSLPSVQPQVTVEAKSISGAVCHASSVATHSAYRLADFYIINLSAHKFNGELYSDNDLDGMVDQDTDFSNGTTVEVSAIDSDEDGIPDFVEKLKSLNPNNKDADKDGVDLDSIVNRRELQLGTDPSFVGDEPSINYTVKSVVDTQGCGAGQPAYTFNIEKILLTHSKKFTDSTNSDPYSLSHDDHENVILVLAKLSPDNTRNPSVFMAKIFKLNAQQLESRNYQPPEFFILGEAIDNCPDCNVTGTGNVYNKIFAGSKHSCAISDKNAVICWGDNSYGQLGDGTNASRVTPVKIKLTDSISSMALGSSHSCALNFTQDVYCWGANSFGQLGDGTTTDSMLPVKVDLGTGMKATHIMAGLGHTCAALDNNSMKCWGRNDVYQLGNGTTAASATPVLSSLANTVFPIVHSSAALNNNCITNAAGKSYCWGGISGCVQSTISAVPTNCAAGGTMPSEGIRLTKTWQMVVTNGYANSGFDTTVLERLTCWGRSIFGNQTFASGCGTQEDDGKFSDPPAPSTEYTFGITRLSKITMGLNHSCGIWNRLNATTGVLTKFLDCWGENGLGALGIEITPPTLNIVPMTVSEIKEPKDVASGQNFSCAIDKDGVIWCWGLNTYGQLGSGDIVNNPFATKIKNQ